jgi:anaerobic selenocysteine-containing dehydrogenase
VRIRKGGPDRYLPDYLPHAGYAGLCGRGSVLADLLDHSGRLLGAMRRGPGGDYQEIALATAMQEMAAALRADGAGAIIIDGNLDLDTVAAAGRLAADAGAAWSVFVPPNDEGLVHGLDVGGGAFIGPEDLANADAILIIGNAYATHPVAAHWIFEARDSHPRMPVLVMADASGVTADFATGVFQPRLVSGEAARAVAAIRTGQAEGLGPEARTLATWKERLRAGKSIAIVVGAELDYADARALGTEVARLAADLGAKVCPLTTCGGAWGAVRLAAAGAVPIHALAAKAPRTLLVMGIDLDSSLGRSAAGPLLDKVERLVYAGPMMNRTSRRALLVLPAAFQFESAGRALLGPGREVRFGPLLPPPSGVPTMLEIIAALGGTGDARADASAPCAAGSLARRGGQDCPPRDIARPKDAPADLLLVAPAQDPFHFGDGSLTRSAAWPQVVRPRPVLSIAESDALAAGLADKGCAVVEGPGGSVEVEVAAGGAQRPGQARISAAFAEVRDMFGWTWDGNLPGEPVRARVRKA